MNIVHFVDIQRVRAVLAEFFILTKNGAIQVEKGRNDNLFVVYIAENNEKRFIPLPPENWI